MNGPERLRLFVAVELPPTVREAIDDVAKGWQRTLTEFRWTQPENLHLTVAFIGDVNATDLDAIRARLAIAAAGMAPSTTHLARVGRFPEHGPARVLWVGLDDADGRITEVARAVGESLEGLLEPDDHPFSPHVTIARARRPATVPDGVLTEAPVPLPFTVRGITLFRSHLGQGPPRYEVLARWVLGAQTPEVP